MDKCLYFICPTDGLETIIENRFHQKKYFYSSLGNSVSFHKNELKQTFKLIQTKNIGEISFILSDDNQIVLDALGNQNFSDITGLKKFYEKVILQRNYLKRSWQSVNPQFLMLSYFLNIKIKELKNSMSDLMFDYLNINAKVYRKEQNRFDDVYSSLICQKDFCLN